MHNAPDIHVFGAFSLSTKSTGSTKMNSHLFLYRKRFSICNWFENG